MSPGSTDPRDAALAAAVAVRYLRTPLAIRARAENVLAAGLGGRLQHFKLEMDRLPDVADRVAAITRARYPDLNIPIHGRLNHLRAGGVDRPRQLVTGIGSRDERVGTLLDLVIVSVLLDAGAGDTWRFHEDGRDYVRSEGLAVASYHAFANGWFSSDPRHPHRADAAGLVSLTAERLGQAFRASPDNPLVGLDGRAALLRRLGEALLARTGSDHARPGSVITQWLSGDGRTSTDAASLLLLLLELLGPIWPRREILAGQSLGDVWPHPAAGGQGPGSGLVPFHKLSQWLTYSLVEPLESEGFEVAAVGALTGLAEYRNGGLLVDLGVLLPRHDAVTQFIHRPGDEVVVEWRALTVALLDRVADMVRDRLGKSAEELPLARVLEGGTWAAGREVAAEKRAGGGPPIRIESDGTVF